MQGRIPRISGGGVCVCGGVGGGGGGGGAGGGGGEGFDLMILPYLLYVFGQTGLCKQCRSRSDAAERDVWSGSLLFATHPAILHTLNGSKKTFWKEV